MFLSWGGRKGREKKEYEVKYFPSMFGFRSVFLVCAPSEEYLSI